MFFDTGDYVILEDNSSWRRNYGVIVKVFTKSYYVKVFFPNLNASRYFRNDYNGYCTWISKKSVLRHMKEQDMKELNIHLDADKYNI